MENDQEFKKSDQATDTEDLQFFLPLSQRIKACLEEEKKLSRKAVDKIAEIAMIYERSYQVTIADLQTQLALFRSSTKESSLLNNVSKKLENVLHQQENIQKILRGFTNSQPQTHSETLKSNSQSSNKFKKVEQQPREIFQNDSVVLFYPKDKKVPVNDLLRKVKDVVKDISQPIGVVRCHFIKNNGVLVQTRNKDEADILKEVFLKFELSSIVETRTPKGRMPTVRIFDIDPSIDNASDLVDELEFKNDLKLDSVVCASIKIIKKPSGLIDAIIPVDSDSYGQIIDKKKVYLGASRCAVKEHFDVHKCGHCHKFGHRKKNCKRTGQKICKKCGQEHLTEECQQESSACWLCSNIRGTFDMKPARAHTLGDRACPAYLRYINKLIRITNYGKFNSEIYD